MIVEVTAGQLVKHVSPRHSAVVVTVTVGVKGQYFRGGGTAVITVSGTQAIAGQMSGDVGVSHAEVDVVVTVAV